MFIDWVFGTGPRNRTFDARSVQVRQLRSSVGITKARQFFYEKNRGLFGPGYQDVTRYDYKFGLKGLVDAGVDPTQQFVGTFKVDVTMTQGGEIGFDVMNTTSFTSFSYQLGPSWSRDSFGPGGNMDQHYTWTEPVDHSQLGGP